MQSASLASSKEKDDSHFCDALKKVYRCGSEFRRLCQGVPGVLSVAPTSLPCSTSGSKAVLDPFYKTLREVAAGSAGLRETTGEEGIPTLDGLAVGGVASPRLWGVHEALENYAGVSALGFSFANGILALEIVCGRQAFSVRASFGRWLAQKDGVGGFSSFLTHDAELDDPPAWDTTTLYACYACPARKRGQGLPPIGGTGRCQYETDSILLHHPRLRAQNPRS